MDILNRFRKGKEVDPLWHAQLATLIAIVLQLVLPEKLLGPGPKYALLGLECLLLLGLFVTTPKVPIFDSLVRRLNAVTLIALASFANIIALERLAHYLLLGGKISNGHELLLAAVNIYLTNIIIFGLWYWELDGGGPGLRQDRSISERDFLFPQMSAPEVAPKHWIPTFVDYLYVSTTNATAFSPTDTLPLSRRVKILMSVQSLASLITVALVAARAVNILT